MKAKDPSSFPHSFLTPKRSRGLRILPRQGSYAVHAISRIVDRAHKLGDPEKREFRRRMRAYAAFAGIDVVTYCLMDNHVHLVLQVPEKAPDLSYDQILQRLRCIWDQDKVAAWEEAYHAVRNHPEKSAAFLARQTDRMADLPEFMRLLLQGFTRWYNKRNDRSGTLWESRYKSVVVEDEGPGLLTLAAYVDLNPVRADMVDDPKEYAWSGYGEACAGGKLARTGLTHILRGLQDPKATPQGLRWARIEALLSQRGLNAEGMKRFQQERSQEQNYDHWRDAQALYRCFLYVQGWDRQEAPGKRRKRKGFSLEEVKAVHESGGHLSPPELLRLRTRAFTRGVALGTESFLDKMMLQYRSCFGPERKCAGRRLKGCWWGLQTLRQPQ